MKIGAKRFQIEADITNQSNDLFWSFGYNLIWSSLNAHVHFTLNNKTYIQVDGVVMSSPLGSVLANIFMVELERNIIPALSKDISLWKRYVDDTICFIKLTSINKVLEALNSYHANIKFTIEIETENKILFLDVLLIRNNSLISTKVHRKSTNTDIYINF